MPWHVAKQTVRHPEVPIVAILRNSFLNERLNVGKLSLAIGCVARYRSQRVPAHWALRISKNGGFLYKLGVVFVASLPPVF